MGPMETVPRSAGFQQRLAISFWLSVRYATAIVGIFRYSPHNLFMLERNNGRQFSLDAVASLRRRNRVGCTFTRRRAIKRHAFAALGSRWQRCHFDNVEADYCRRCGLGPVVVFCRSPLTQRPPRDALTFRRNFRRAFCLDQNRPLTSCAASPAQAFALQLRLATPPRRRPHSPHTESECCCQLPNLLLSARVL
jgi:hypothetical protein